MAQAPRRTSGNPAKRAASTRVPARKTATKAEPDLVISAEVKKKVIVELIGETYSVTVPKASLAIKIAQRPASLDGKITRAEADAAMKSMNDWIERAFGVQGAKRIHTRLDDPFDDLDLHHLMQLMNSLMEMESGNPTT